MKIARPSKAEVPFKRKRSPPPQATKLLRYSFLASVVFMVLLAIVFIPRMFRDQTPVEIVQQIRYDRNATTNTTRLYVDSVTATLELAKFRANLTWWASLSQKPHAIELAPGLAGGNATLHFFDSNANGLLDVGDYFGISPPPADCYRFAIFQVDVGKLAGYLDWPIRCP